MRPILLLLALLLTTGRGLACPDLGTAPSSRWTAATRAGVSWLVTPCGEPFFSIGINNLNGGSPTRRYEGRIDYHWGAFQPDFDAWLQATRARVAAWAFNTAGAGSLPPEILRLPIIPDLELGRTARFHWVDPFDPASAARMREAARQVVTPYRGSPYRIGYFSDNEAGWWNGALFGFYVQQPPTSHTKRRLVALLRARYADDWARFRRDFVPPPGVASFDDLLQASGRPVLLRPGGAGIRVVRRWTGVVAARYYRLVAEALRAADPDALLFGDRLPIYYDPDAVRAMAPWVDAIATNYNVDSPDGWIAPYYFEGLRRLSGGKPVLVSEWFFAAHENRTGNRNNGHLMTVATQDERARGAASAAQWLARDPQVVGLHWFQYYDHPKGGRSDGEDYDFGLVDIDDRPYETLVDALGTANRRLAALHRAARPHRAAAARRFVIPRAAIDARDRSLGEWPKEPALVSGVVAEPGEVPFGDFYLAASATGLHLATIDMDYYDPTLLAFDGDFPRQEAFRIDWGIDAGAGARRFTLRIIPPRVFPEGGSPMMHAELCRENTGSTCTEVPGAVATYFGSDQPRLTVEVSLPWAALGVRERPRRPLRMELAATAWHRSRWMSWSGRPPAEAMRDPAGWHIVTLAGAEAGAS